MAGPKPNKSTAELIAELESRTRFLNIGKFILLIVVSIGLAWLVASNYRLQNQNKVLLSKIALQAQQIKEGNDSIHQQINCVLDFFAQPAPKRTASSITNPHQCIIGPDSHATASKPSTNPSASLPVTGSSPPKVALAPAPTPQSRPAPQHSSSSLPSRQSQPSASSTPPSKPGLIKQIINFLGL